MTSAKTELVSKKRKSDAFVENERKTKKAKVESEDDETNWSDYSSDGEDDLCFACKKSLDGDVIWCPNCVHNYCKGCKPVARECPTPKCKQTICIDCKMCRDCKSHDCKFCGVCCRAALAGKTPHGISDSDDDSDEDSDLDNAPLASKFQRTKTKGAKTTGAM